MKTIKNMTTKAVKLGRWLGVLHRVGSDMCYWILTKAGKVILTTTVQHVTCLDTTKAEIETNIDKFNQAINCWWDDTNFKLADDITGLQLDDIDDNNGAFDNCNIPTDEEYGNMKFESKPDMNNNGNAEFFDNYIGTEITVQRGDSTTRARVKKRVQDKTTFCLIVKCHNNPYMNTAVYKVEFPDGNMEGYSVNLVAENLYLQCDAEGNMYLVVTEISDHKRGNDVIPVSDSFVCA